MIKTGGEETNLFLRSRRSACCQRNGSLFYNMDVSES